MFRICFESNVETVELSTELYTFRIEKGPSDWGLNNEGESMKKSPIEEGDNDEEEGDPKEEQADPMPTCCTSGSVDGMHVELAALEHEPATSRPVPGKYEEL